MSIRCLYKSTDVCIFITKLNVLYSFTVLPTIIMIVNITVKMLCGLLWIVNAMK